MEGAASAAFNRGPASADASSDHMNPRRWTNPLATPFMPPPPSTDSSSVASLWNTVRTCQSMSCLKPVRDASGRCGKGAGKNERSGEAGNTREGMIGEALLISSFNDYGCRLPSYSTITCAPLTNWASCSKLHKIVHTESYRQGVPFPN